MPNTLTPQEFVAKWRHVTLKEKSASQSHFNDLCALLGQQTPTAADPTGKWFVFEAGAGKVAGGQGWADVWKTGYFAWEYKGQHANLDKAYLQLLQYREALLNPPLLIVCDLQRIVIHTNFTNTAKQVYNLTLEDLLNPAQLAILRKAFTDPDALRPNQTPAQVTEQAAAHFARLAQLLRKYGNAPQPTAHFLIRLLFCLFAEDAGILPDGLFTTLVTKPHKTASAFSEQLSQLFAAMTTGGPFGVADIPHVDGGLFNDAATLDLGSDGLRLLAEVSGLDWSAIEPAIFGTLFERGLDPDKRSQLGAHFTAEADIRLVVEPVLMAPLRRKWARIRAHALALAERRGQGTGVRSQARARLEREIFAGLRAFRAELAAVRVLDPACGSGNFLYVSLRLLLDLEREVINLAVALGDSLAFPLVTPGQLRGIEINPYAFELAQVTIWIGYIQWLRENGFGLPTEPILKPLETIQQMDAILAAGDRGQETGDRGQEAGDREPAWPAAEVIVGNPPFLGGNRIRKELGDAYVDALFACYAGRVPAFADLVCYWFEKARAQIAAGQAQRAGLLATQAIRGGANRKVLERIKETGDIFWAYADRDWILNGATVHVSMVGFDDGTEMTKSLDNRSVMHINSDLTSDADLTSALLLPENANIAFIGDTKKGKFDIPSQTAAVMLAEPINPNGRSNHDVIKPWMNGIDITQQPRNMYIIDFGVDMPESEAALYEQPFEHVKKYVKPERDGVRNDRERTHWWIHGRPAPDLRRAIKGLSRYIATPRVAKHRLFVFLDAATIPDGQVVVFARDDDYLLGVLHSRIHELWARQTGTQLREAESGFRYSQTMTFETFPFPWPPGQEPAGDDRVIAIAQAAAELVAKRDAWLHPPAVVVETLHATSLPPQPPRTLTALYNARPAWLDLAHRALDAAVLAAYGWPADTTDDEVLARLLALNRARAGP
jgi:type II restriction/modification system DNA methylase subunit YeeA